MAKVVYECVEGPTCCAQKEYDTHPLEEPTCCGKVMKKVKDECSEPSAGKTSCCG